MNEETTRLNLWGTSETPDDAALREIEEALSPGLHTRSSRSVRERLVSLMGTYQAAAKQAWNDHLDEEQEKNK